MTLRVLELLAYLALTSILAGTACVLFARVRSGAAACMALGLCAIVLLVVHSLSNSLLGLGRYTTPAIFIISYALFTIGFVWLVVGLVRRRGPHNPRMEADAATPTEGEGSETE
jgi:hypothetical protein